MNVTVILPAAGSSARFGRDKLSCDLGGRPLLVRTVEAFSRRPEVQQIIVAGPPGDGFESFTDRFGPVLGFHGVLVVPGGKRDRWETVSLALAEVASEATHVAVHDAARPCVADDMLDRVFEAAASLDAVIPGVVISSTIKEIDEQGASNVAEADLLVDSILGEETAPRLEAHPVLRTVPRDGLVLAQTPQVFARQLLMDAYAGGCSEGATDDASVVERFGASVHVVPGDPTNVKVTRPEDLRLAELILRAGTGAARGR
ncbi:MAG: 2-C-methyl-D-erythritol 4-phosphate cytidylyltransferase [Phycisphaerales bacterium]|jgi:2-C-methyl-D-erythritol 4-phosphate cytidylyltransferase|nr:2-C-methyl-D-erythritol 4-phosphate cytidylyltransferase [Phycisphaerales bacterium]MDP6312091.1 2-C-methyl-D-erythritol 4-phosphate cytidylyltransferase [Phycisphaerales bacterium]MDP7088106.1 2-C-methyl-D-erythritol 4-phosphate cytidylyltransferase [Phycisphaerales bacterium]MDP7189285.1 2-C-methyl-D-erythritol 4-phosphate cytidylyltransferase [Phycisphaerales bacterium]MDP7519249.1 2-C-methyl-D-erythritol 4-phosphate cytidylyltransferase [Phycisphaerales bacterium]|tara:strand:+ start:1538 stop:2314 length:777 start_codon:yes stop_codon:yes gene_type:complete